MLHAVGAYSVLCGFASGELGERLGKTVQWLQGPMRPSVFAVHGGPDIPPGLADWLQNSSSLSFRIQSYKELCERTKQSGAKADNALHNPPGP